MFSKDYLKALGYVLTFVFVQGGVFLADHIKPSLSLEIYVIMVANTFFLSLSFSLKMHPWPKPRPNLADDSSAVHFIAHALPALLRYDDAKAIARAIDSYQQKKPDDDQ